MTLRERLAAGARIREGSAELARRATARRPTPDVVQRIRVQITVPDGPPPDAVAVAARLRSMFGGASSGTVTDETARAFFDERGRLAPGFGVTLGVDAWDDVAVSERLLIAATLQALVDRDVLRIGAAR